MDKIKEQIETVLAEIETLAKKARFENVDLDKTARDITLCASVLKDLRYRLAQQQAAFAGAL